MGKKREKPERHKQNLGDQLEDPETYGVRVGLPSLHKPLLPSRGPKNPLQGDYADLDWHADKATGKAAEVRN